jgi:hypothetical protein
MPSAKVGAFAVSGLSSVGKGWSRLIPVGIGYSDFAVR